LFVTVYCISTGLATSHLFVKEGDNVVTDYIDILTPLSKKF